ncbi:hypothetical protein ACGFX2_17295 [Streptomyces goshikiensis]|uniref:hypothetical protein n=1 Tax=Streptomyces goshikiensis TaxID=1942 RepID=UPI00371535C0
MRRTTPATRAEVDTWLTVLLGHGHLHRFEHGPDGAWTVWRTTTSTPFTLHHPVLAIDYVARTLLGLRRPASERHR